MPQLLLLLPSSVVEPFASGLGGGGYAVIHIADTETVFVDYQSMAPGLSTGDMFVECPSDKSAGYRSILVPGYLAGLTAILGKYGTLDLKLSWRLALNMQRRVSK